MDVGCGRRACPEQYWCARVIVGRPEIQEGGFRCRWHRASAIFMAPGGPTLSVFVYGSPVVFFLGRCAKMILPMGHLCYQKVDMVRGRGVGSVLCAVGGVV